MAHSHHGHAHRHAHSHGHPPEGNSEQRIAWAFALNAGFAVIEIIGGLLTNSTAILADAVHDLGDSLAIGLAWILARLARRDPDTTYTYGYRRFSLLGALINSLILILGSIWVLSEAIPRLFHPEMPHAEGMIGLALLGVAVNGYAAYKLSAGSTLNERVLNWHLLEDVLGWVAVLIVSVALLFVDWPWLDPALSIVFTVFILVNVVRTLRSTLQLFLQGTPEVGLSERLRADICGIESVENVHHLHVWSLDGEHHVLTSHVEVHEDVSLDGLQRIKTDIELRLAPYGFQHTTIEVELKGERCRDRPLDRHRELYQ
ncbi:MAG: cation transporter [Hahellaceae bacterium]|nr:cation transporter [Hahellaceae bacterium]